MFSRNFSESIFVFFHAFYGSPLNIFQQREEEEEERGRGRSERCSHGIFLGVHVFSFTLFRALLSLEHRRFLVSGCSTGRDDWCAKYTRERSEQKRLERRFVAPVHGFSTYAFGKPFRCIFFGAPPGATRQGRPTVADPVDALHWVCRR